MTTDNDPIDPLTPEQEDEIARALAASWEAPAREAPPVVPKYRCPRCVADPQPESFGAPRDCAFTAAGHFTPDNWNCATVGALFEAAGDRLVNVYGTDESIQVIPVPRVEDPFETNGFLVFSRYKRRGRDSSAVYVGDFWPPEPVTLTLVADTIAAYKLAKGVTP